MDNEILRHYCLSFPNLSLVSAHIIYPNFFWVHAQFDKPTAIVNEWIYFSDYPYGEVVWNKGGLAGGHDRRVSAANMNAVWLPFTQKISTW